MTPDTTTARRMITMEPSEEEEVKEQRRYQRFRDMLWEHLEGCHERYRSDMNEGESGGAYRESQMLTILGERYFGGEDA